MLTFIAVAVAGLALGLLAEVLRRPFGTTGAVLTAAASCAVALALWVPRSDDERALWLFLTFAGMFWLTTCSSRRTGARRARLGELTGRPVRVRTL